MSAVLIECIQHLLGGGGGPGSAFLNEFDKERHIIHHKGSQRDVNEEETEFLPLDNLLMLQGARERKGSPVFLEKSQVNLMVLDVDLLELDDEG